MAPRAYLWTPPDRPTAECGNLPALGLPTRLYLARLAFRGRPCEAERFVCGGELGVICQFVKGRLRRGLVSCYRRSCSFKLGGVVKLAPETGRR
jgi:hypothetical protein